MSGARGNGEEIGMTIVFTGRKAGLTEPLREHTERRLEKLERFLGEIRDAHVILTLERHRRIAEVVVNGRIATIAAKAEAADFHESISRCSDRLLVQAKKQHDRLSKERKRQGQRAPGRHAAPPAGEAVAPRDPDGRARVIRMGRISAKPMSVQEAVLQVTGSRDPFLVFRNAESQQIAVIFRRPDGRYGLVEEET
jgi:ribosome hibernation promoting factor